MNRHLPAASLETAPHTETEEFRTVMREVTGTVSIVTSGQGDDKRGLTVTALCSLSVTPPSLLVCVNKITEGHKMILRYGSFCVNVVSGEQQSIAECFAGRTGHCAIERFTLGDWTTLVTGSPVLLDAIAVLDCDVIDCIDRDTHTIFIGGVRAVKSDPNRPALVYRAGLFHIL